MEFIIGLAIVIGIVIYLKTRKNKINNNTNYYKY
jgi:hypothetical protein